MKTSCINHPERNVLIIKREWQMKACDGDGCAAALMSFFEYWHNVKLEKQAEDEQTNLYQWHTMEALKEAMLEYGERRIRSALQFLQGKGFISAHRNPSKRFNFDNTKHYLFHPEVVNKWLEKQSNCKSELKHAAEPPSDPFRHLSDSNASVRKDHTCKVQGPPLQSARTIPAKCQDHSCKVQGPYLQNARTIPADCREHYPKITYMTTPEITSETTTETTTKITNKDPIVSPARPREDFNPPLHEIFNHWKDTMRHPNAKLDEKRRRLMRKALQAGYDVTQLCQAITGCSYTPHNMGDNDRGQRYDGLHVILRDADQIDRFIANNHSPPKVLNAAEKLLADNIRVAKEFLATPEPEEGHNVNH